jgi:hypothetical protein
MALKKLTLRPGVNRENTRYTNENGWYESDKIRFRQGTPEKIGGWVRISANLFVGVCRSLSNWVTLGYQNLLGVGTNIKFYIENGGAYYDITPISVARTLTDPFTTNGTTTVAVTDSSGGFINGGYVTFSGATAVGGQVINGEYQINLISTTSYSITITAAATAATGGGNVSAVYQISPGPATVTPQVGWGSGTWSSGVWGSSGTSSEPLRLWNQNNFGEDLLYGPRGGPIYYWDASIGYIAPTVTISIAVPALVSTALNLPDLTAITLQTTGNLPTGLTPGTIYYTRFVSLTTFNLSATPTGALITTTGTQSGTHSISPRGIDLTLLGGALSAPLSQNYFLVSDVSRFVICFGTNDYLSSVFNPMLIRWSDQEKALEWVPGATTQAGSVTLSHGSEIVTALQSRQEILVWTDSALYSLQYLGPPIVWGTQLQGDNISIISPNAAALASGVTYWMGVDKFYKYDGRVSTLRCDLLRYVYGNVNLVQADQIFASTNEGFNEVWFFYCSKNSMVVDSYVVYNYTEAGGDGVWYYGSLGRTAWIDVGSRSYPIAATYANNLVNHENGVDDGTLADPVGISASITSAQFDLDDGNNMAFSWRMLPDLTFVGSTDGTTPSLTMQLLPLKNSGSGYNNPKSVGGVSTTAEATVTATQTYPIDLDTYNGQINIRIRARQMAIKVASTQLGTQWQLGSPRIELRTDGKR